MAKKFIKKILVSNATIKSLVRSRFFVSNSHDDSRYEEFVKECYRSLLNREPTIAEIEEHLTTLKDPIQVFDSFIKSQEFCLQQQPEYTVERASYIKEKEEYIRELYRVLLKREPEEIEVDIHIRMDMNSADLLKSFIASEEYSRLQEAGNVDLTPYIGLPNYVLGQDRLMSASMIMEWYKKAALFLLDENKTHRCSQIINNSLVDNPSNEPPILTIITSLYKGEKYIETFLKNITSQTIFNQCCLFIINANSPESEELFIKEYLEKYPHNIVYKKLNMTIGIYEAWNFAINNSISEFITNANLDDLHRKDAMELKVQALQNNPQIDVVYSDVYYSFLENLPFEIVEKCGISTNLPVANKFNLLQFNSPHNSPMWRRSLHQKIGYFDTIYKSAGDYEFWLRAAFSGSLFMKIPHEVLVSYYHNPKGLSTRASNSNQGVSEHDPAMEGAKVHRIYRSLVDNIEG